MIITNWTEMMWHEWATATHTLLHLRGRDQWSVLWNEQLDRRIDQVLRMYGVENINLDAWEKELMHGLRLSQGSGTNDLHRMQTDEAVRSTDLSSLSYEAEADAAPWWRRLRHVLGSYLRSYRSGHTASHS